MAKILLVEDDNNLREIYEARLQAEGYTIVSAQDGEEALVVAKAEKPDLIISDVMMPKISGFEMLDILRNTDGLQHVKVIMLTALGQSDDQQRATKLGADRYLVKSQVTLEDIVKTAHDLLADEAASEPTVPGATSEPTPVTPPPQPAAVAPVATTVAPVAAPPQPAPTAEPTTAAPATPAPTSAPVVPEPPTTATAPPVPSPITTPATPTTTDAPSASSPADTTPPTTPVPAKPETDKKAAAKDVAAADDKLMNDAVNALIAETEKQKKDDTTPAEPPAIPEEPKDNTAAETDQEKPKIKTESSALNKPSDTKSSDTEDSSGETSTDQVPIAHKKVIKPLEGEPKKDINELLALEEAKEAGTAVAPASNDTPAPADPVKDEKAAEEALEAAKSAVTASSTSQEEASVEAKIEDFVAGASTEPSKPTPAPKVSAEKPDDSSQPAPAEAAAGPTTPASDASPSAEPAPAPSASKPEPATPPAENQPATPADDVKNPPDPNTIAL